MRIKTWRGAVVFCVGVTAVALVVGHAVSWFMLPRALFWEIFGLHNFIVMVIAPPIALWGGFQIRDRTLAMDRLQYMVNHDHLTQLFTRTRVIELAEHMGGQGQILLMDIDHFKRINDSFGHLIGDRAIFEVGKTLASMIGPNDLAGRFGGEEFIVFLADCAPVQGFDKASALCSAVAAAGFCDGRIGQLTLSIGVASQMQGADIEAAMRRADEALYTAKSNGRNRVCAHDGAAILHCGEKAFAIRAVAP